MFCDSSGATEVGNLVCADRQFAQTFQKLIAGSAGKQSCLTIEQKHPDRMLLRGIVFPALIDGPIDPSALSVPSAAALCLESSFN